MHHPAEREKKNRESRFEVIESDAESLNEITLGASHGGIVAITGDRTLPCLSSDTEIEPDGFYAMIQGIEDPYNFGYSIRSLYACGCDGIILGERNWMSAAGVVCRSSAGASELFDMYEAEAENAVKIFKEKGYKIVCGVKTSSKESKLMYALRTVYYKLIKKNLK